MSTDVSSPKPVADIYQRMALAAEFCDGRHPDPTGQVTKIMRAFAEAYLECARKDFAIKSGGGTGSDGISWPDLAPATKVQRQAPHKKMGERPRGLLTDQQDKRWRGIFAGMIRKMERQPGKLGQTPFQARTDREGTAAAIAWHILKAEGAQTMKEKYSSGQLPILVGEGRLEGSLSPGHPDNILEIHPGGANVGSKVPYFNTHQNGDPSRNIPQRQIFPTELPDAWATAMLEAAAPFFEGMIVELVH